ncbi:MAG: hypothetical protein IPJ13_13050 [Saprospiraceae bacterium]|nr:hypothetical protein [Saprospiraceae bacterium]
MTSQNAKQQGQQFLSIVSTGDGTFDGYDIELYQKACTLLPITVIACGGVKGLSDLEKWSI